MNAFKRQFVGGYFTAREWECLCHALAGRPNKQIAEKMKCSVKTVEKHRQAVMNKLDAHGPIELVRRVFALRVMSFEFFMLLSTSGSSNSKDSLVETGCK